MVINFILEGRGGEAQRPIGLKYGPYSNFFAYRLVKVNTKVGATLMSQGQGQHAGRLATASTLVGCDCERATQA